MISLLFLMFAAALNAVMDTLTHLLTTSEWTPNFLLINY